jgi:hypothetical protein
MMKRAGCRAALGTGAVMRRNSLFARNASLLERGNFPVPRAGISPETG